MKGDRRYEQTETAALALRCAVDDRLAAALRHRPCRRRNADARYAFDGVAFSIYRVAEPTAAGYALTGPFDDCRVRLPRPEDGASVWKDAAETPGRVCRRKAADSPGHYPRRASHVCGTGAGLHLAVGDCHTLNGKTYIPVILLAEVTGGGSAGADVKWEWDDDGDEPGGGGSESRISLRVEKRWLGDDPAERPSSVELWLLRDGALMGAGDFNGG